VSIRWGIAIHQGKQHARGHKRQVDALKPCELTTRNGANDAGGERGEKTARAVRHYVFSGEARVSLTHFAVFTVNWPIACSPVSTRACTVGTRHDNSQGLLEKNDRSIQ
jgi:hypothetical protein